jgi:multiple sugar transport system permease protein
VFPRDFEEAARVDGATRWQILWNVIVPMARPAIAVLALFSFIGYWNNFLWPLVVGNTREMATRPVELNLFNGQHGTRVGNYMMAASTISILPTAILTVALQNTSSKGFRSPDLAGARPAWPSLAMLYSTDRSSALTQYKTKDRHSERN